MALLQDAPAGSIEQRSLGGTDGVASMPASLACPDDLTNPLLDSMRQGQEL
jgi:hypothetical protein